jgi:hypothetical protein
VVASTVVSAGAGLGYAAMPASIMNAVPQSETAAANGINSLMRSIGTSLASAVISAVLAVQTVQLGAAVLPSRTGLQQALAVAAAAVSAAVLLSVLLPRRRGGRAGSAPLPGGVQAEPATSSG